MKKVSIIIPVYNSEKYLCQCLESILNQTHKNFEVLLVCDKGKDNSDKICKEYAKKCNKIFAFVREKGSGVSAARNFALDHISEDSEYVAFIDADDWVEPRFLETLIKNIETFEADLSYCGYKLSKPTTRHLKTKTQKTKVFTINQSIRQIVGFEQMTFVLWNKLYKTSFARNIRFDEKIKFVEDTLWVFQYLTKCHKVVASNQKLYHYIKHPQSALKTGNIFERITEIETYEQISQMAEKFSQTAKCFMRAWQYIMMVEKLLYYKKSKLKMPEIKQKIINAIKYNKPYFLLTKKHFVFYRKLVPFLEKII